MAENLPPSDSITPELMSRIEESRIEGIVIEFGYLRLGLRSKLISSFDLLHVATLDYLLKDALIEKILNIKFRYFGIAQSDDLLDGFQALYGNKSIRRQILQKVFVSYLGKCPVRLDMSLKNGEAPFFLSTHNYAGFDKRLDKVLYHLRILLDKRLRAHERAGRKRDLA